MKCKCLTPFLLSFVIVLGSVILLSLPVKAATTVYVDPPYPVGLPDFPDYNADLDISDVERVKEKYINLLSTQYNNDVSGNYCIILTHANNSDTYTFTCFNIPELVLTNYIDRPQEVIYRNLGQHYVLYVYDAYTDSWTDDAFAGGWVSDFTVRYQDLLNYGNGWVVDMAQDELYTTTGILFWSKDVENFPIGVTPLPDVPDPDNPTQPTLPPVPPYDPDISIGENIGNWFSWLGSLLGALFSNLLSNLKNFVQTLKDTITNGFKNLVDNLTSLFKPFFDNITALVNKIKEKIEYLTEIPTPDTITDLIEDTQIYGCIESLKTNITGFINSFSSVQEPDTYAIPVHLENLNNILLFRNLQTEYIDLGILDPVKSLLRLFIAALTTYGLILTIIDSIANYINGGGDE